MKFTQPTVSCAMQGTSFSLSSLTIALVMTGFSTLSVAQTETKDVMHVSSSPLGKTNIAVAEQVDIIDAQSPEKQSAASALDLLKGEAGVFVTGNGSTYGQAIQMRGYDQRGVKITVDNVTQDFNSGLYDATFIDPTLVKSVAVHKGSGSLHHGGGALGGVVAFKTLNASDILKADQKVGGRLFSGINRNDHSYTAGASLLARTDSLDSILSYSQRKIQLAEITKPQIEKWKNYVERSKIDYGNLDSHEKIHNWMLKTTWFAHSSYHVSAQFREYYNTNLGLRQPTLTVDQVQYANTPHQRNSHQRDFILNQHFSPDNALGWQTDWDIYYTNLYLQQIDLVKESIEYYKQHNEERHQYTYGSKLTNQFNFPIDRWVRNAIETGVEYYQQQQKPNEQAISYPNAKLSNASGWINNDITLHHLPVTFSVGTRFTHYQTERSDIAKDTYTNWSSRYAVSVTPTHWLNLHSSYSEAYRTPRMAELYNDSLHFKMGSWGLRSYFKPSPDLKPETNKTTEVGFKLSFDELLLTNDSLQFGSTYFMTKAQNHISVDGEYIQLGGNFWLPKDTFYVNIPSASIYGADSFINYHTNWFNLSINHNKTIGKEDGTNHSLSSVRPETLFIRLNAPLSTTGFNLGWRGEFTAKTKITGDKTYQLKNLKSDYGLDRYRRPIIQYAGYGIHDFYINYKADQFIEGLSSTLSLKNAFDREYVSSMGVPQEGRNFFFNVNYQW